MSTKISGLTAILAFSLFALASPAHASDIRKPAPPEIGAGYATGALGSPASGDWLMMVTGLAAVLWPITRYGPNRNPVRPARGYIASADVVTDFS